MKTEPPGRSLVASCSWRRRPNNVVGTSGERLR
jgi:hypothetical protein